MVLICVFRVPPSGCAARVVGCNIKVRSTGREVRIVLLVGVDIGGRTSSTFLPFYGFYFSFRLMINTIAYSPLQISSKKGCSDRPEAMRNLASPEHGALKLFGCSTGEMQCPFGQSRIGMSKYSGSGCSKAPCCNTSGTRRPFCSMKFMGSLAFTGLLRTRSLP